MVDIRAARRLFLAFCHWRHGRVNYLASSFMSGWVGGHVFSSGPSVVCRNKVYQVQSKHSTADSRPSRAFFSLLHSNQQWWEGVLPVDLSDYGGQAPPLHPLTHLMHKYPELKKKKTPLFFEGPHWYLEIGCVCYCRQY